MKKASIILIIVLIAIQFIRVDISSKPIDDKKALHPPKEVEAILEKACYDCHSNKVRKPWYANIAPFSWTIASHIKNGRKALNFSKWEDIPRDIKKKRLERAIKTVNIGIMPLPSYKWIHKDAILTPKEKKIIESYFQNLLSTIQ